MKNSDAVIYINGDSWCDNRFFKELLRKTFPDHLIINASVQGNWNSQINTSTINDVRFLANKFNKVHCFVYYSECLRGHTEDKILKTLVKQKKHMSINFLLEELLRGYHHALQTNVGNICKLNMTTAFIDKCELSTMRPMYQTMINHKPLHTCYSLSKHVKDHTLLESLFDKQEHITYLDDVLARRDLLENIPGMKDYHPNNESLYKNVVSDIQEQVTTAKEEEQ